MRKIIAIVFIVAVVLLVAGCVKQKEGNVDDNKEVAALSSELESINALDQDLNATSLDSLDQDLDLSNL